VAVQLTLDYPDRVGRLIPVSVSFAGDGYHEEITDPARHATSTRMPTQEDFGQMREAYARVAPDPGAARRHARGGDAAGRSDRAAGQRLPALSRSSSRACSSARCATTAST
jgi:pimeloyl-ACP methyl ester carboxylesterase